MALKRPYDWSTGGLECDHLSRVTVGQAGGETERERERGEKGRGEEEREESRVKGEAGERKSLSCWRVTCLCVGRNEL